MAEEIEVNETEIELPDYFNREPIAYKMCGLIVNAAAKDISPIVLDGPWGSGKTVHAKRMAEIFNSDKYKEDVKCVYWNAASSDFAQNPLPMFMSALYQNTDQDNRSLFSQQGLVMCKGAFVGAVMSLANQLCKGYLKVDVEGVKQAAEVGAKQADLDSDEEKQFEEFLKEAGDETQRIQAAVKLLNLVRGEKQLIVIIDELDRCRPDFALKMLECIKHLFTAPTCKFVLVMNKNSMASSVQHLYGLDKLSSKLYLNKYIKWEFQLPHTTIAGFNKANCAYQYFYNMMNKAGFLETVNNKLVQVFIARVVELKEFSLREVEKLVGTFNFIEISGEKDSAGRDGVSELLKVFVSCLKTIDSNLVMNLSMKQATVDMALQCVGLGMSTERHFDKQETHIRRLISAALEIYLANEEKLENVRDKYIREYSYSFVYRDVGRFCSYLSTCSFLSEKIGGSN